MRLNLKFRWNHIKNQMRWPKKIRWLFCQKSKIRWLFFKKSDEKSQMSSQKTQKSDSCSARRKNQMKPPLKIAPAENRVYSVTITNRWSKKVWTLGSAALKRFTGLWNFRGFWGVSPSSQGFFKKNYKNYFIYKKYKKQEKN